MVGVEGVATTFPATVVTVGEAVDPRGLTEADRVLLELIGIETVRDAGPTTAFQLAATAGAKLLTERRVDPLDVDLLVVVPSRVPEKLMASELTRLQQAVGAANAVCLGSGDLGCTSSSTALLMCDAMLRANPSWLTALVVHGCKTPVLQRHRRPVTVNGDCGVAALVTRHPRFRFDGWVQRSDGRFWDLFGIVYRDVPEAEWREHCTDERAYRFRLALESKRVLHDLVTSVLAEAGLGIHDVDHLVMQNISSGAFRFYEEVFGREVSPVCRANLARFGHLGPADILVNLASLDGVVAPGEGVLVLNNSPSAAWSAGLLTVRSEGDG